MYLQSSRTCQSSTRQLLRNEARGFVSLTSAAVVLAPLLPLSPPLPSSSSSSPACMWTHTQAQQHANTVTLGLTAQATHIILSHSRYQQGMLACMPMVIPSVYAATGSVSPSCCSNLLNSDNPISSLSSGGACVHTGEDAPDTTPSPTHHNPYTPTPECYPYLSSLCASMEPCTCYGACAMPSKQTSQADKLLLAGMPIPNMPSSADARTYIYIHPSSGPVGTS